MIEEVFVFRTFEAASTRLGGVRRWANGDSTNVSGLPGARNGRRLDANRQPTGGCRLNALLKPLGAVSQSDFRAPAFGDIGETGAKFDRVDRLGEKVCGAGLKRLEPDIEFIESRHDENGRIAMGFDPANSP